MIRFARIRGRAAGHVVVVNALNVMTIEPTAWGGSEINFSDVYAIVSRDSPQVVQQLLEGRLRLCQTPLCDRDTIDPYTPVCARCKDRSSKDVSLTAEHVSPHDLVIVGGKHGFT